MAAKDPQLGQVDTWAGDPITLSTEEDPIATLYHTDSSYYSQIGRLALVEAGVDWRSRHVDIHSINEHLQPWYLAISPGGCVPTLIHKGKVVPDSRDIIYYVAGMEGAKKLLLEGDARTKVDSMVELHYKVVIEDITMGKMLANPVMKFMFLRKMASGLTNLEIMEKENTTPEIAETISRKITQRKGHLERFSSPGQLFQSAHSVLTEVLDIVENQLEDNFICGTEYCLADVLFTCLFARLTLAGVIEQELATRPKLSVWWEKMKTRESYEKAKIVHKIDMFTIATKFCSIM